MKIAIVGAGIVGVSTAYELACDGHEVTVFERHGAAAEECSFANAGVLAPGYVTPWAAPGMPLKVLRDLLSRHAAVRLGPGLGLAELRWMWRWWRACEYSRYQANRARMIRLARYSQERLNALTAAHRIATGRSDAACRRTSPDGRKARMVGKATAIIAQTAKNQPKNFHEPSLPIPSQRTGSRGASSWPLTRKKALFER